MVIKDQDNRWKQMEELEKELKLVSWDYLQVKGKLEYYQYKVRIEKEKLIEFEVKFVKINKKLRKINNE